MPLSVGKYGKSTNLSRKPMIAERLSSLQFAVQTAVGWNVSRYPPIPELGDINYSIV
jgi:hypothetical protein